MVIENADVPAATEKIQQSQAKKDDALENKKMSIDAISHEEIIRENLKEIFEKKSREERKANGRLVAVIVAFIVIFMAVYHAYIRKSAAMTGVLIPAAIMVSYGGWVVLLAKRDKQRRALFEKHLEEVALKNKHELEMKNKAKHKKNKKNCNEITLHFEDEINRNETEKQSSISAEKVSGIEQRKHHRKHHRQRRAEAGGTSNSSNSSSGSRRSSSHHATKDLRAKRPSIRQKLFRQNAANPVMMESNRSEVKMKAQKKKKLQHLDALAVPQLVRIGSAP